MWQKVYQGITELSQVLGSCRNSYHPTVEQLRTITKKPSLNGFFVMVLYENQNMKPFMRYFVKNLERE